MLAWRAAATSCAFNFSPSTTVNEPLALAMTAIAAAPVAHTGASRVQSGPRFI